MWVSMPVSPFTVFQQSREQSMFWHYFGIYKPQDIFELSIIVKCGVHNVSSYRWYKCIVSFFCTLQLDWAGSCLVNNVILFDNTNGFRQGTSCIGVLSFNSSPPGQNGHHVSGNTFRCILVNELWLKLHWSLFLEVELTIFQHWFRQWLGVE